jgi:hypothetical protein
MGFWKPTYPWVVILIELWPMKEKDVWVLAEYIYIYDGDWYWSFGQYINDSVEDFGDTAQVDCE